MTVFLLVKSNSLWEDHVQNLKQQFPQASFVISDDVTHSALPAAEVVVAFGQAETIMERAPGLKAIIVPMAGVNQFPFAKLADRGISLANAHGNGRYVAERALTLTLAYFGKVVEWHNDLLANRWHGFAISEPVLDSWHSIVGSRVAILGTGEIGRWTARLLRPFDVTTVGFRRRNIPEGNDPDFDSITTNLIEAVSGAGIVICTLPLTEESRGMIDAPVLKAMHGAVLVNVGRGAVVDEAALRQALTDGTLPGAALDTWWQYPRAGETVAAPSEMGIHELPNVVLSPHVGGYTAQATRASVDDVIANIRSYLKTGKLRDPIDLESGY